MCTKPHPASVFFVLLTLLGAASLASAASLTLVWDRNSEADLAGYRVYQGSSSGQYGSPVSVGNVTQYDVTGLNNGATYYFAVTAIDQAGNISPMSTEISVTTQNVPLSLVASAISSSQINLSFGDTANEEDFKIERCQGAGCSNFVQIASVLANVTSFSNTGLSSGTSYSYRVRAHRAGSGDSGYSNIATAITSGSVNPNASVSQLLLVSNTNPSVPIMTLVEGSSYDILSLPSQNLNVEAKITSSNGVQKVMFVADAFSHTENSAPYALCGDWAACPSPSPLNTVGSHTLTVTPYDSAGVAGAIKVIHFSVTSTGNHNPVVVASAAPKFGPLPLNTLITCSGSDADGGSLSYDLDFGDGSTHVIQQNSAISVTHTYNVAGSYSVVCKVTDNQNATVAASFPIDAGNGGNGSPSNRAPIASLSGQALGSFQVQFTCTGTDPDRYQSFMTRFIYGDGIEENLTAFSPIVKVHRYAAAGRYTAQCNLRDGSQAVGTSAIGVIVAADGSARFLTDGENFDANATKDTLGLDATVSSGCGRTSSNSALLLAFLLLALFVGTRRMSAKL